MRILNVDHHRNGVSGEAFHVVNFDSDEGQMLGVVFPTDGAGEDAAGVVRYPRVAPRVAVFRVADLPCTAFGVNSWRGDLFADELYAAVEAYEARRAGVIA